MNSTGKKAAQAFRKKYGLLTPTLEELRALLLSQGYTVVEFNAIFNDADVAAIIEELNLESQIAQSKGFTYADCNHRLVFLHEDLSIEEKRNVLLHEEGHIFCGHIEEKTYIGRDVQQEMEANAFSYCLLHPGPGDRCAAFIKRNRLWLGIAAVALVLATGLLCWTLRERTLYDTFYITETGNKYHRAECIHVKNKNNTSRLTVEQFESGDYEPCATCLPQG